MKRVIYRDIAGFAGYRVGSDGTVWSCKNACHGFRDRWKKMKLNTVSKYGHLQVSIGNPREQRVSSHIGPLVLRTFIGPPPVGMECRHLDGDAANNNLDNLIWGTRLENAQDRKRHGHNGRPQGSKHHNSKLTESSVRQILKRLARGDTCKDIASDYDMAASTIRYIKIGRGWVHVKRDDT